MSSDEPFPAPSDNDTEGARFYLKRMLKWAEDAGIKVLLDLHGGPGGQNGFDNSGRRGYIHWHEVLLNEICTYERTLLRLYIA